jgi:ABC-type transporter Mla maintaining outer membrane lipid asymmetry ATPase subunit MlaF
MYDNNDAAVRAAQVALDHEVLHALAAVVRAFPRMTVLENVITGAFAGSPTDAGARDLAHEALERVGLAGRQAQAIAGGLTTKQLRLLELARALASRPKLLLLDEPAAGLNHEELSGGPISIISAALIIADKSDVHRSRVQNPVMESFDIHDRVNYAVTRSRVVLHPEERTIELGLTIDTTQATVMEYFEIFLSRMVMCRKSAQLLGYRFQLTVNGTSVE